MADQVVEKKGSKAKTGCLVVVGVIVAFGVIGSLLPEPTPEEKAAREAEAAAEARAEAQSSIDGAVQVTARDLAAAYEQNEVAAQQTYGDRDLLVTGTVTGVTLDFANDPVIQLAGVNQFLDVQASVDDPNAAASINRGDSIRVLCKDLSEVISAPMLGRCTVVE